MHGLAVTMLGFGFWANVVMDASPAPILILGTTLPMPLA